MDQSAPHHPYPPHRSFVAGGGGRSAPILDLGEMRKRRAPPSPHEPRFVVLGQTITGKASGGEVRVGGDERHQLLRELRILSANRPMQFTKLMTKYYKGERAKQILETLKAWPSG